MILIIDDDSAIRATLSLVLTRAGYTTAQAETPETGVEFVRHSVPDLIIMDMNYSGASTSGEEGLELLRRLKVLVPAVPVILISAWGSIPLAVEGMRLGAIDFITKPWNNRMLLQRIATVLSLSAKADIPSADTFDRAGIIGRTPALENVLSIVRRIAPTDAPVLILGENGTGKELIAEAIHRNSRRAARDMVKVNLGGIPQQLFESEMFGHKKGAFTGAVADRKGRFEMADQSTIFLDEIGDLDPASQVKMLRVLQEHTFEPLGDSRRRSTDIRVICATNADIEKMVAERSFREDLYYRINLITLTLPPLRERRQDIPLLIDHFLIQASKSNRRTVRFAREVTDLLSTLPYPGNIRELRNTVERLMLISDKAIITLDDIPAALLDKAGDGGSLESMERKAIEDALSASDGNLSQAAATLGITRQALYRRIEKYRIRR